MDELIINGSKVVEQIDTAEMGSVVMTEDGKHYYWRDTSYRDDSTGMNFVPDGEWMEV